MGNARLSKTQVALLGSFNRYPHLQKEVKGIYYTSVWDLVYFSRFSYLHSSHCCCCCLVASVVSDCVRSPGSPVPGILQALLDLNTRVRFVLFFLHELFCVRSELSKSKDHNNDNLCKISPFKWNQNSTLEQTWLLSSRLYGHQRLRVSSG